MIREIEERIETRKKFQVNRSKECKNLEKRISESTASVIEIASCLNQSRADLHELQRKRVKQFVMFMIDLIKSQTPDGQVTYRIAGFTLPNDGNYLPLYNDIDSNSVRPNLVVYGLSYATCLVNLLAFVLDLNLPHGISNK